MGAEANRLPAPAGARIDRDRALGFSFEGRAFRGYAGDTIASALAANDEWVLSRSFKYHRPRAALSMAGQDANTLVQLPDEPNVLADRREIAQGLAVMGQNYAGSLAHDRRAVLDRLGAFLPVGFYYKAFYRPRGAWRRWEPIIRAYAGLGKVALDAAQGTYDKAYLFCDVAVVGGGPAGMAAALAAAGSGAEVVLIDENPTLGGALGYARFDADGVRGEAVRAELIAEVAASSAVRTMCDAVANALYADNWLAVIAGKRLYKLRAGAVLVATGAMEQPIVFRNNDLPGVMLGTAAQRLIRHYGVRPGRRAVVVTANEGGYGAALDLAAAGVEVVAVVDVNGARAEAGAMGAAVAARGITIRRGHAVVEAVPRADRRHVAGLRVAPAAGRGGWEGPGERLDCDLVCMSTGYTPTAHLLAHAGAALRYDEESATFAVSDVPEGVFAAGSVAGRHDLDSVLVDARHAGWAAARFAGPGAGAPEPPRANNLGRSGHSHPWPIFPHPKGRDFIDFDEDLEVRDIRNAAADGYAHPELLKRYSTLGMGPSQGRHSALPGILLAAEATGRAVTALDRTTMRPPYMAESFAHLAGRRFEPVRETPMHRRHLEAGATMMPAGPWYRPAYYGAPERARACIRDEALNVRGGVAMIDVSTLGGLEVRGPDAAEFMERMYTFAYAKQPVGRARYVLMTDVSGVIVDDGIACRMAEDHFYVTATTTGAQAVYTEMLWHNAQWRLKVDVTNVTAAFCGINIAGPGSRAVLAQVCSEPDLSAVAFPYMGVREGTVAGIPARLLRVGFVGELGYEIHAPAASGEALWDALTAAGAAAGLRPFGVEAQRLLRLEKGHILVGQDTDGLTNPHEAAMSGAISRKKPFFVGGRSIEIQARRIERMLVGFSPLDPSAPRIKECHLVLREGAIAGRVTSCAFSPTLERVIGLAYVAPDQAEVGAEFTIKVEGGRLVRARVETLPFYDAGGTRQEM